MKKFDSSLGKARLVWLALVSIIAVVQSATSQIVPADRLITWQGNVGIPGGVPNRTTIYQTIAAGATMATIQSALNSCPSNQVVLLGPGTFNITGVIILPSYVTLRGSGPGVTILNAQGSGNGVVQFGSVGNGEYTATAHNITAGYTKGSTTLTLDSVSGISAGTMLVLDQLNDASLPVSNVGTYGTITWNSRNNGTRALGQTVEVGSVSGNTVTIKTPMYWTYQSSLSPQAMSYQATCQYAGLENLTLYANQTGYTAMFFMSGSKYCWVKNIEDNYCDGDHGELIYTYRCEVRDSYFHDAYNHNSGTTDSDLMLDGKSSGDLVENNIFYRMHTSILIRCGSSGNVIAYNYSGGNFHQPAPNFMIQDMNGNHGAHPMFNLFEGNICNEFQPDSYWGSSSHCTALRNWFTGDAIICPPLTGRGAWQTNSAYHATQALNAVNLNYGESYYNLVGNIVGCAYGASHDTYQVVAPASRSYTTTLYLYAFGYSDSSDNGSDAKDSTLPYTTVIRHGDYDFANGAQTWSPSITDHNIPNSYYLTGKPAFFGNMSWPPFNPANGASVAMNNLPAGYRFNTGTNPPTGPVNLPPVASATGTPVRGPAPLAVTFSSSGSSDPEGATLTYSWAFGDGSTSTAANPSHTYSTAGTYSAVLTVSDGTNTVSANPISITATVPGQNLPPIPVVSASPVSGIAPLAVTFSSTGSYDPEGATVTYSWAFGDGATSTTANPSHTYTTVGNYTARLTVSDGTNSVSTNAAITVISHSTGLVAAYGFEDGTGSVVSDSSTQGNSGAITGATWTAGKFGNALDFTATNSSVTIPDAASLDLTTGMTLEAWVYPTALSTITDIIYKDTLKYYLAGSVGAGTAPSFGGDFAPSALNGTNVLALNTWSHLAGTYDGTTMRLYVNGVLVSSLAQSGPIGTSLGSLMIGGNPLSAGKNFTGKIDEVRIYNRALGVSEIQLDMNTAVVSGVGNKPGGPNSLTFR
jgi:PKD repeat protein